MPPSLPDITSLNNRIYCHDNPPFLELILAGVAVVSLVSISTLVSV